MGISAPDLITNIVAGVATAPPPPNKVSFVQRYHLTLIASPLFAAESSGVPTSPNTAPDRFAKKIFIKSISTGPYRQETFRNRVMVIANVNGQQIKLGELGVGDAGIFDAPPDTAAITLVAFGQNGSASQKIDLPEGKSPVSIEAQFDVRTTGTGDLQWAFGAPREGSVTAIELKLLH